MNALELSDAKGVPIQSTLMIVNNFVVTTVRFLNHFSSLAEEKLNAVADNITRLEVEVTLVCARTLWISCEESPPPLFIVESYLRILSSFM